MVTFSGRFFAATVVAMATSAANVAWGEINVASSLEWIACSAELVVLGKSKEIKTTRGPGDVFYEDCVLTVERSFKKDLDGKEISFTLRRVGTGPTAEEWIDLPEGVLVFLVKSKDHGSERHLDGKWVPANHSGQPALIDVSRPANLYLREMKFVAGKMELLRVVEDWAKSSVKHSLHVEVPTDSPIFSKLYAGSACFLIVPAEEKYRGEFLKLARSPNPYQRAKAARELSKFPGEETEAVLRSLLKDDFQSHLLGAQDQIQLVSYHVRAAAHQSLKSLGHSVPDMELNRPPTADEQRKLREKCWSESFASALPKGWKVSVADGPSRRFDDGERYIVLITCRHEKERGQFTLVPKEWPAAELPDKGYLGLNGPGSQGARRFYYEGDLSDEVRQQVVAYFGLEK